MPYSDIPHNWYIYTCVYTKWGVYLCPSKSPIGGPLYVMGGNEKISRSLLHITECLSYSHRSPVRPVQSPHSTQGIQKRHFTKIGSISLFPLAKLLRLRGTRFPVYGNFIDLLACYCERVWTLEASYLSKKWQWITRLLGTCSGNTYRTLTLAPCTPLWM